MLVRRPLRFLRLPCSSGCHHRKPSQRRLLCGLQRVCLVVRLPRACLFHLCLLLPLEQWRCLPKTLVDAKRVEQAKG